MYAQQWHLPIILLDQQSRTAPKVSVVPQAKSHHAIQGSRESQLPAPYRNSPPSMHLSTQHPVAPLVLGPRASASQCALHLLLVHYHPRLSHVRKMAIKTSKRRVAVKLLLGMACMDLDTKMLVIRDHLHIYHHLSLASLFIYTSGNSSKQESIYRRYQTEFMFLSSSECRGII